MKPLFGILATLLMMLIVGAAPAQAAPTIYYDDISIREDFLPTISIPLYLSSAPTGLAGYTIKISGVPVVSVSVDITFAIFDVKIDDVTEISGSDVLNKVGAGSDIPLAIVEVQPAGTGTYSLHIDVKVLDDDFGDPILFGVQPGAIEILPFPTLPGLSRKVADLDGDGLAEDVNGNGRLDFDDLSKLFMNIDSPEVVSNADLFDWNGNGVLDFEDLVEMFERAILGR